MLVEVANAANLASIIDNDISILFDTSLGYPALPGMIQNRS